MEEVARPGTKIIPSLGWIFVVGPGLLVMLADTDAGNVVTGRRPAPNGAIVRCRCSCC